MANYATAVLQKAQLQLNAAFSAQELRFNSPEIHNMFVAGTQTLIPEAAALRKRTDSPSTEFSYALRQSRTLGTAISSLHTGTQGDSGLLVPAWSVYTDKFASTLKEANNKIPSLAEIHMDKMKNTLINFAEQEETIAETYLFSNRSSVNIATTDGVWDAIDNTFEIVEATNGNEAISITEMIMRINKYKEGGKTIVCDPIAFRKFKYLASQGVSNATNTSFQFGNVKFLLSISLGVAAAGLVSAYSNGYWIVVPDNTVACPNWIPIENRTGVTTSVSKYSSFINPFDGLNYGMHTYESNADSTALGGYLQDVKIETQIQIQLAYTHAPLSVVGATPLMAFAFV